MLVVQNANLQCNRFRPTDCTTAGDIVSAIVNYPIVLHRTVGLHTRVEPDEPLKGCTPSLRLLAILSPARTYVINTETLAGAQQSGQRFSVDKLREFHSFTISCVQITSLNNAFRGRLISTVLRLELAACLKHVVTGLQCSDM